jgi:hypothetical protein
MRTDPTTQAAILALIPGSVELGPWKVRPIADSTAACTMLDTREAHLPSGALPEDRMILLHEEGHIRWDLPSDQLRAAFPAVTMPYVSEFYAMLREWVIDMRLTTYVEDIRPSSNLLDWAAMPDPVGMPLDAIARQFMQWYYRSQHPSVVPACELYVKECWSLLDTAGQALLTQAYQDIKAGLLDDTISETWAVKLAAHFLPPPPPPQKPHQPQESAQAGQARQQAEAEAQSKQAQIAQARAADASASAELIDTKTARAQAARETFNPSEAVDELGRDVHGQQMGQGTGPTGQRGAGGSAVTTIAIHPHMNARRTGKRIKDPIGMKRQGSVPTHTEYLRMGGAIFKESPKPSGAILIDVSSSMNWSEEQLQAAIKLAPNLIVAGYANGLAGPMLCVIAKNGRTSHSLPCNSGGINSGTDIPALLWLAQQPEPRIIVSDGGFYGNSNAFQYERVCAAIMKRHKIIRVQDMESAIDWLKGRKTDTSSGGACTPLTPNRRRR